MYVKREINHYDTGLKIILFLLGLVNSAKKKAGLWASFVTLGIFICSFISTYGQNANCNVLSAALKDSFVRQKLYLNDPYKSAIVVIDVKKYVNECPFDSGLHKNVLIIQDSATNEKRDKSDIIIRSLSKKNGVYKLKVYQEDSQAYGYILLKSKNGKYVIIKLDIGNF